MKVKHHSMWTLKSNSVILEHLLAGLSQRTNANVQEVTVDSWSRGATERGQTVTDQHLVEHSNQKDQ